MSGFFRRLTGRSTRKQKESVKPPSATQLKEPSATQLKEPTKIQQNLKNLNLFFTLKLTNQEKEEYIKNFTQSYLWEHQDDWIDYLLESIEKDDLNAVLFWLNKVTDFPSIERRIDEDVYDYMTDLLDKMRDMKREYLFWDRPYFNQLKKVINPETRWWYNHLYNSLDDPNYIKKLMDHSWKVMSERLIVSITDLKPNKLLITYIINHIYTNDNLSEYRFNNYKSYIICNMLLAGLNRSVISNTQKDDIKRFYLNYLIFKRGQLLPPLTFDMAESPTGVTTIYVFDKGLYPFIMKCLAMNETSILQSFVKAFDIKRIENDTWFKFLLECIIRTEYVKKYGYIPISIKIDDIKKLVSFIIKAYKINLNNVYMNQPNLFQLEQPDDPIRNPKIWLDKNVPMMAWAVLYKNKDAIDFFIEHGAILNRCVISMQDLTNDPAILGRFDRESKARKIQVAYSEYKYSPSHPSQQRRATAFKEKYQTTQSMPPIEEEQTGGKKKKTLKKKLKKRD